MMGRVRDKLDISYEEGLISIIVPVYNCSHCIGRCIDSILEQTYSKFELIIVFNELSEDTCDICEQYEAKDSRIRLLKIACGCVSGARNLGLEKSNGEFIAFIDSDDRIEPGYLGKLLDTLRKNDCCVAMCDFDIENADSKPLCNCINRYGETVSLNRMIKDFLYGRTVSFCWGKLWRRDAIYHEFRPYRYSEDLLFVFENLAGRNGNIAIVHEILYHYIKREGSITARKDSHEMFDSLRVAKKIIRMSGNTYVQFLKPAYSLMINYAFFTILTDKTGDISFSAKMDDFCVRLIKKYRAGAILDPGSTVKTKCACLLSLISMRLVKYVYSRIK